jgi:hypothetical protein
MLATNTRLLVASPEETTGVRSGGSFIRRASLPAIKLKPQAATLHVE